MPAKLRNLPRRTGPDRRVALILDPSNSSGRQLMQGIARFLQERGLKWLMHLELGTAEEAPGLRLWKGDGIIARVRGGAVEEALRRVDIPKLVDRPLAMVPGHTAPTLVFQWNQADGQAAFAHFAARGFRHFAFCTTRSGGVNWEREERFALAVANAGRGFHFHPSPPRESAAGRSDEEEAKVEQAWVAALPKPVGIYTTSDMQAYRVLEACRVVGAAVPDIVAVLGPDNDEPLCELCLPQLSSMNLHVRQVGYQVAEAMEMLMSGGDLAAAAAVIAPPDQVDVVVRGSTNTLAIGDKDIKLALAFIRDHACERIGVRDVVMHTAISRRALERRFRQTIGCNPAAEIRRVRLEQASRLLLTTNDKLPQIARLCGFANAPRLTEAFKRAIGQSPTAFRRKPH